MIYYLESMWMPRVVISMLQLHEVFLSRSSNYGYCLICWIVWQDRSLPQLGVGGKQYFIGASLGGALPQGEYIITSTKNWRPWSAMRVHWHVEVLWKSFIDMGKQWIKLEVARSSLTWKKCYGGASGAWKSNGWSKNQERIKRSSCVTFGGHG